MAWNFSGNLLATVSKDSFLRVFDSRGTERKVRRKFLTDLKNFEKFLLVGTKYFAKYKGRAGFVRVQRPNVVGQFV